MSWEAELRQAEADFANIVLPAMRRGLPRGRYYSVQSEGLTSPTASLLDRQAGIDWLVEHDRGVSSVASRVQWMGTPCLSFTIGRYEMAKRLRFVDPSETSADHGPTYTVQAYLRQRGVGPFLAAVSVDTHDLYSFVREHPGCVQPMQARRNGRPFWVVWADCLWDEGVPTTAIVSNECRAFRTRDGVLLTEDLPRHVCDACRHESEGTA